MRRSIPVLKLFGKKVALPTEAAELALLDKAIKDIAVFEHIPTLTSTHPLYQVQHRIKPQLYAIPDSQLSEKFKLIHQSLDEAWNSTKDKLQSTLPLTAEEEDLQGDVWKAEKEAFFRLTLTKDYFKVLENTVQKADVNAAITSQRFRRLLDSTLVGTSSERVQEHMQLFGDALDEETLQICFYAIYEAEIESTNKLLAMYPTTLARHQKKLKKLSTDYLLDKLELNVKTRCVLAWSDPGYSGFKPLPDDFKMPIQDLLRGRQAYFKEGAAMGKTYLNAVRGTVNEFYEKKNDRKDLMKKGAVFFVVTCLLDWLVCSL